MPSLFAVKFPDPQFKHFLLVAMRSPMRFQTVLKDEQGYYLNPECLYTRTGEPVPRIPLYRIPGPHEQFTDSPDMIGNPSLRALSVERNPRFHQKRLRRRVHKNGNHQL